MGIILKSSSIMNVTPVVGVNQIGDRPDGKGFFGRSMAIDAKGIIIGGISDKEGYFVTRLTNPTRISAGRLILNLKTEELTFTENGYKIR